MVDIGVGFFIFLVVGVDLFECWCFEVVVLVFFDYLVCCWFLDCIDVWVLFGVEVVGMVGVGICC